MKTFIVLSCVLVTAYGVSDAFLKDLKIKMADVGATCVTEVGANEADISEIMARKMPSRKEGRCLISCFLKKFHLQGADGKPDREGTMALLEPLHDDDAEMYTKLIQIAIKCGPEVSNTDLTDHCDIALEIVACSMREGKLIGVADPFALQG
ncbi:hypothetical protein ILUMI_01242 [Ignelater luminosus]|uniref:Uncharacterized protein n=1 Tax=Ignelater luminosus TaxID=2038154 RepID=A0A8K0DIR0_IGNLU|nr:hypothetical protein ILUMI_01242 [Ignelater luminosus]